jgi:hypothetical protein
MTDKELLQKQSQMITEMWQQMTALKKKVAFLEKENADLQAANIVNIRISRGTNGLSED